MKISRLLVFIGIPASAMSCARDEQPPPEQLPIPLDSLCTELASADCERLKNCGALSAPFDLDLCRLRQEYVQCAPIAAALRAAVDSGSLTYFELAARDCRDAVADLSCAVGLRHELFDLDACRDMLMSEGVEGDPCPLGLACAEGFHCVSEEGCPGRCRAYRQNNETCAFGQICAPDLFCSVTGMRCHARVDLGGTCELTLDNNPCRDGGFCESSNPADMRCVGVRGRGQGCTSSFECVIGASCIDNRCSAGLDGDVCRATDDCDGSFVCSGGRCSVPLAIEQPCSEGGTPCSEGLVCTSSVGLMACHPRPIASQTCGSIPCYLSRCQGGSCRAAVLPEESCSANADCFPGYSCSDVCTVEPIACTE